MRLSDAIMLGSTQLKFNPQHWYEVDLFSVPCGCLIGMGMVARYGIEQLVPSLSRANVHAAWPWLTGIYEVPKGVVQDQFFRHCERRITHESAANIISFMAYAIGDKQMTIEEAVDWIRQHEPKEEEVNGGNGTGGEETKAGASGNASGADSTGHDIATTVGCSDQKDYASVTGE